MHVPGKDLTRYQVRAYDIGSSRLDPRVIADRRQASWVMRGYPLRRVTSADGRWVIARDANLLTPKSEA